VQGYDYYTMRMLADDRYTRRVDEASAEHLAGEIRGSAGRHGRRVLGAAWSGLAARFRTDRVPEQTRAQW
jgi:hypothetical protein